MIARFRGKQIGYRSLCSNLEAACTRYRNGWRHTARFCPNLLNIIMRIGNEDPGLLLRWTAIWYGGRSATRLMSKTGRAWAGAAANVEWNRWRSHGRKYRRLGQAAFMYRRHDNCMSLPGCSAPMVHQATNIWRQCITLRKQKAPSYYKAIGRVRSWHLKLPRRRLWRIELRNEEIGDKNFHGRYGLSVRFLLLCSGNRRDME